MKDSIAEVEAKAWKELEAGDWDAALSSFERLQAMDATSEAAYQGLAAVYRKKRLDSRAQELISAGLERHPTSQGIWMERVWLAVERNRYGDALDALDKVLAFNSRDADLFLQKALWLRETRRFHEAAETLRQIELNFPRLPRINEQWGWLFFHQGLYDEALQAFQNDSGEDLRTETGWQGIAAALRKKGMFRDAADALDKAQKKYPHSDALQNERAWLLFEEGFYPEAAAAFEAVILRSPEDPSAYVNQSWVYIQLGGREHLDLALARCRRALSLEPLFPPAFSALGLIAFKQKRINEAEAYLLQATRVDLIHGPYADLGALYIQLGRYTEAERALQEAVAKLPYEAYVHMQLGSLYLHTNRTKDAIGEFRIAVGLAPSNPEPPRALSIALLEAGEGKESLRVIRHAIARLPGNQNWILHLTLAQLLIQMGDDSDDTYFYSEAFKTLNKSILSRRKSSAVVFYLGLVYSKLGQYTQALKCFRSCLQDEEYSVEANLNIQQLNVLVKSARTSRPERLGLGVIILIQLGALWYFYLHDKQVSDTVFTVVVPLLLGLLLVAVLLPWLTKFKVSGFEAELSEPEPRSSLASGPKGQIGFHSPPPSGLGKGI